MNRIERRAILPPLLRLIQLADYFEGPSGGFANRRGACSAKNLLPDCRQSMRRWGLR